MFIVVVLILLNIVLTVFSVWGAVNAFNNTTLFGDVIGINAHKEALLYLIPLVVAGVSALVKPVKLFAGVCAFVITVCGAYVVYDTWNDTVGNAYECFGNTGLDLDKQKECAEQVAPKS